MTNLEMEIHAKALYHRTESAMQQYLLENGKEMDGNSMITILSTTIAKLTSLFAASPLVSGALEQKDVIQLLEFISEQAIRDYNEYIESK